MKLTYILCACLLIAAAAERAARAEDYIVTATGTITDLGSFEPYVYGEDESVEVGTTVNYSFVYDDSVASDAYFSGNGTNYPSTGDWSLTFADQSYSGPRSEDDGGVTVSAAEAGDNPLVNTPPADGFLISDFDGEDYLVSELALQTNTSFTNENLSNLDGITLSELVQPSSGGLTQFDLYDSDDDLLFSASVDELSVSPDVVPEPSTWSMLFGGMVLAAVYFRRRSAQLSLPARPGNK